MLKNGWAVSYRCTVTEIFAHARATNRNIEFEGKWGPSLRGETLKAPILYEIARSETAGFGSAAEFWERAGSTVIASARTTIVLVGDMAFLSAVVFISPSSVRMVSWICGA